MIIFFICKWNTRLTYKYKILILSHNIIEVNLKLISSFYIRLVIELSFITTMVMAWYLVSMVDFAMIFCFLKFYLIRFYINILLSMLLSNQHLWLRVLFRYCKTYFTINQYIVEDWYINYNNLLIVNEIFKYVNDKYYKKLSTYHRIRNSVIII